MPSKHRKLCGLLAIDGGGSRGVIPARILQHLQRVIGKTPWEMFDFSGGVSTGGLLILSSLIRRTPSDQLVQMYKDMCGKIFPPRPTWVQEYPSEPLELVLKEHFRNLEMVRPNGKGPRVFVITKRGNDPEPFLLRNYPAPDDTGRYKGESDWSCTDAARATTAAYTFFSPYRRANTQYTDGGMGFNNPTQVLFNEAISVLGESAEKDIDGRRPMPHIDFIVSIGTGKMDDLTAPVGEPKTGLPRVFEAAQLAVELITNFENVHLEMQQLTKAYGNIEYFRLNPRLPDRPPLDTRTAEKLDKLINLTDAYLSDDTSGIPNEIKRLSALINRR